MRVDEKYMTEQKITTDEDWNYSHNLSYLVAACAEAGRYKEGLEWANKLKGLPSPLVLAKNSPVYALSAGSSMARLRIRFGDWQAVLNHPMQFGVDAASVSRSAKAYEEGLVLYVKGTAALEKGTIAEAGQQADALDALLWRLSAAQPKDKDKDEDDPSGVLRVLDTASLDLRGNVKSFEGKHEEAFKLLEEAADKEREMGYREPPSYSRPAAESLGYAYLRARQWGRAREAFTQALHERPQNGHALYGIAQSYALAGQIAEASQAYEAPSSAGAMPTTI